MADPFYPVFIYINFLVVPGKEPKSSMHALQGMNSTTGPFELVLISRSTYNFWRKKKVFPWMQYVRVNENIIYLSFHNAATGNINWYRFLENNMPIFVMRIFFLTQQFHSGNIFPILETWAVFWVSASIHLYEYALNLTIWWLNSGNSHI